MDVDQKVKYHLDLLSKKMIKHFVVTYPEVKTKREYAEMISIYIHAIKKTNEYLTQGNPELNELLLSAMAEILKIKKE